MVVFVKMMCLEILTCKVWLFPRILLYLILRKCYDALSKVEGT